MKGCWGCQTDMVLKFYGNWWISWEGRRSYNKCYKNAWLIFFGVLTKWIDERTDDTTIQDDLCSLMYWQSDPQDRWQRWSTTDLSRKQCGQSWYNILFNLYSLDHSMDFDSDLIENCDLLSSNWMQWPGLPEILKSRSTRQPHSSRSQPSLTHVTASVGKMQI